MPDDAPPQEVERAWRAALRKARAARDAVILSGPELRPFALTEALRAAEHEAAARAALEAAQRSHAGDAPQGTRRPPSA